MPDKRSDKSPYESEFGGGFISAPQHLAEIVCKRKAGETTPGNRFWMNEPWQKEFRTQLNHANTLLKKFNIEAIKKALVSPRGKKVTSLGAPFFRPMIEFEQSKLELAQKTLELAPLPESINTLETPRPVKRVGKSIREKLSDNGPTERGLFSDEIE